MAMPLPASSVIVPVLVIETPLPMVAMETAAPVPALRMVPVLATWLAELPTRIALPPAAPPVWMVPPLLMVMAEEKPPMLTAKLPVLVEIRPVLLTVMLVAEGLIWKRLVRPIVPVLASATLSPEQCSTAARKFAAWFGPKRDEQIRATLGMQLAQVEQRLSRLTDGYVDRFIDQETFVTKKEALLFERGQLKSQVAKLSESRSEADNLEKFLELLKRLAQLYETSDRAEKRQIVELTTSNRAVSGKTVSLEPQDWLLTLQNVTAVHCGAPTRVTSRMSKQQVVPSSQTEELTAEQVERIFAAMKSEPVRALHELLADRAERERAL